MSAPFGDNRIAQRADLLDLDLDHIAGLEPQRRLSEKAHAFGRARRDDVARGERREARDIRDDCRNIENEIGGAAVLDLDTVEERAQLEIAGLEDFIGCNEPRSES